MTNFQRESYQKELKNDEGKSKAAPRQSAVCTEIEFKVACDVTESVNFAAFHGFCDFTVTGNFELDCGVIS